MPRWPSAQPTEVELEILQVLWQHGPCPLGEIHEAVAARSQRAYSTTRKMIQVMRDKGLVTSDDSADRAFGGSTRKLVMSLVSAERLTVEEVREMQRLVKKTKGKKK